MEATQPTQRRESTFLELSPLSDAKITTVASPVDETNLLSSTTTDAVPAVKTQRSASESSTSSRFLRLGHANADE